MNPGFPFYLQQASHYLLLQIIAYLLLENQKLRKSILKHSKFNLSHLDRMLLAQLSRPLGPLRKHFIPIVHRKTVEKWFRRLVSIMPEGE
ncbi:MAG: hypothetical protein AAGA64_07435 [Bacteroidota bacterium]